jgi:hypothetical protein
MVGWRPKGEASHEGKKLDINWEERKCSGNPGTGPWSILCAGGWSRRDDFEVTFRINKGFNSKDKPWCVGMCDHRAAKDKWGTKGGIDLPESMAVCSHGLMGFAGGWGDFQAPLFFPQRSRCEDGSLMQPIRSHGQLWAHPDHQAPPGGYSDFMEEQPHLFLNDGTYPEGTEITMTVRLEIDFNPDPPCCGYPSMINPEDKDDLDRSVSRVLTWWIGDRPIQKWVVGTEAAGVTNVFFFSGEDDEHEVEIMREPTIPVPPVPAIKLPDLNSSDKDKERNKKHNQKTAKI